MTLTTGLRLTENDDYYLMFSIPGTNGVDNSWRTFNWESSQKDGTLLEASPQHLTEKNLNNPNLVEVGDENDRSFVFITGRNIRSTVEQDLSTSTRQSPIFLGYGAGTYNIYIYMKWTLSGTTNPNDYANSTDKSTIFDSTLSPDKMIFAKTARYVRVFDGATSGSITRATIPGYQKYSAILEVKVEKVEEPRIVTWSNSNNFTNPDGGVKMVRLGNSLDGTSNDSMIKNVSANTKAIDYYAFNVPYTPEKQKHYMSDANGDPLSDVWYDDSYLALNLGANPVKTEPGYRLTSPLDIRSMSQTEINQINSYSTVLSKMDYNPPYSASGWGNGATSQMEADRKLRFVSGQTNIVNTLTSSGDPNGVNTAYSSAFIQNYDYRTFFMPKNQGSDTSASFLSTTEYHFVVRLYYTKQASFNWNNYILTGISIMAVPYKTRRLNTAYFIKKSDWEKPNLVVKSNGLVDLSKSLPKLSEYYMFGAIQRLSLTDPARYYGDDIPIYRYPGYVQVKYSTLFTSGTMKTVYESTNVNAKYYRNSWFNFVKTRVYIYE